MFGATGGTGQQVVRLGLQQARAVIAPVRRLEAMPIRHTRLTVLRADVRHRSDLAGVLEPEDVVISVLGIGRSRADTDVYSTGTSNVIEAMRSAGSQRLLCLSTSALEIGSASTRWERAFTQQVLHRLLEKPYADMARMEDAVRGSGLDWTLVRAARLTNGARTGRYRLGPAGSLTSAWSIGRADVAEFLLAEASDRQWVGHTLQIAY